LLVLLFRGNCKDFPKFLKFSQLLLTISYKICYLLLTTTQFSLLDPQGLGMNL
jgi:hypothetical protein